MRYVVEVDAARVAYRERMLYQFGVVVTVEWPCVRVLHPAELIGDIQHFGRDPAIDAVGVLDRFHRLLVGLRGRDFPLGFGVGKAGGEHSPVVVLRGQEHKFGHGISSSRFCLCPFYTCENPPASGGFSELYHPSPPPSPRPACPSRRCAPAG